MATPRTRCRLDWEMLEARLALSAAAPVDVPSSALVTTAAVAPAPTVDTIATLEAFTKAYRSRVGDSNYNPAFDLNHNGQIGQTDGKLLLRALPPVSPRIPLNVRLLIAPEDQAKGPVPVNLGGVTHSKNPIVLGHTAPGALIFTGTGTIDVKLTGPAYVSNAKGNFAIPVKMSDGINQFDVLIVTRYGQQYLRAFPILWLDFAQYEAAHPKKT